MDPHSGLAYFHVGLAYSLKREFEKALTAFHKAKALAVLIVLDIQKDARYGALLKTLKLDED
jgi:hypothetical protein